MKTLNKSIIILASCLFLSGCGSGQNMLKHMHSSLTGLNRNIKLYDANGKVLGEWDVSSKVEDNGGTCYFIDKNGKAVTIAGTFIIQEK